MLRWASIFLIVAIVAAILGFGAITGAAANVAIILFWIFLAVCVILFIAGLIGGSSRPIP